MAVTSNDWTAYVSVAGLLLVIGGIVKKFFVKRFAKRRTSRQAIRKTVQAVWGTEKTDFEEATRGIVVIVAEHGERLNALDGGQK